MNGRTKLRTSIVVVAFAGGSTGALSLTVSTSIEFTGATSGCRSGDFDFARSALFAVLDTGASSVSTTALRSGDATFAGLAGEAVSFPTDRVGDTEGTRCGGLDSAAVFLLDSAGLIKS